MDEFNNGPEENIDKKESTFKKVIRKITDKDGFYIVLFICICIVATTAVWVSKNNYDKLNALKNIDDIDVVDEMDSNEFPPEIEETDEQEDSDIKIVEVTEPTEPEAKETEEKEAQPSEEQKTNAVEVAAEAQQAQEKLLGAMIAPVSGNLVKDYADDKLVYSKTLEQWTTHNGIDIEAKEGTAIRVALDGIVSQIKKDSALGIVITVDHGSGIQTRYGNLSTDEMVTVGQELKKGDPISGVGKGSGYELAEGPHLHFEVIKDGANINPKDFLPKFK